MGFSTSFLTMLLGARVLLEAISGVLVKILIMFQ